MTREKFIRIHRNRGYQVEELGKMVTLSLDNYRAIWFFTSTAPDAVPDEDNPPTWHLDRS